MRDMVYMMSGLCLRCAGNSRHEDIMNASGPLQWFILGKSVRQECLIMFLPGDV